MNDVITLIKQTKTVDEYGDEVINETSREIFCEVRSIGMKEFYQAQATGLQPEIAFRIADYYDYEGERYLEYEGQRYHVLRTFRTGIQLDITCNREVIS